jgi:hypothetical protein
MANSTFAGPIRVGTNRDTGAVVPANVGNTLVSQGVTVTATAATSYDNTIYIPAGSQIVDIIFDTITAFTTSGVVLIGSTAAGGQEYVTSVSIATQGRTRAAPTTHLALWQAPTADATYSSNAGLWIRVTAGGTAGKVAVTVIYKPV